MTGKFLALLAIASALVLTLAAAGCDEAAGKKAEHVIFYIKDARTGLCFADTLGGFVLVPCTPTVEALAGGEAVRVGR